MSKPRAKALTPLRKKRVGSVLPSPMSPPTTVLVGKGASTEARTPQVRGMGVVDRAALELTHGLPGRWARSRA